MMNSPSIAGTAQAVHVQVLQPEPRAPLQEQARDHLLRSLPAAHRVLQIGGDHASAAAYRQRHPAAQWQCADSRAQPQTLHGSFDLIVISDGLHTVPDPARLLRDLAQRAAPGAALFVSAPNAAQWSALQRVIETDLTTSGDGAWGSDTLHQFSPSSLFKLLLDAGWMPHLAGAVHAGPPAATQDAAMAIADAAGVPRATAKRTLDMRHLIVEAQRGFDSLPREAGAARFSVVVPTTRDSQLRLNVAASPGLAEVQARVLTCRAAANPAQALSEALPQCHADWVLFCHQDVYFPEGFGEQLNALLATIPADRHEQTLIGFAGMAINASADGVAPAGFVIDRLHRFDHPASERALSIDELAIVVSRHSIHRIDPDIGWHLWATELCLKSICTHQVFPRIVRLPLFHNSLNDHQLPPSFHRCAHYLAAKYPSFGPIHTLCGVIEPAAAPPPRPAQPQPPIEGRIEGKRLRLDSLADEVDQLVATQQHDAALEMVMAAVHHTYRLPEVAHQALYYPQFDLQLMQLADALAAHAPAALPAPRGTLLVATELYNLGGHSRALEDVSHEVDQPTVVLTDVFRTYARDPSQLDWVRQRFAHARLVVLPDGDLWSRSAALRELACKLAPERVLYFGHHQDPVPFVGTLALPARKVFFHHGDHNPSLGCTLGLGHVDFTQSLRDTCAHHLQQPDAVWLPLYVPDLGARRFAPVRGKAFSVVTSGHPAKFARGGPHALQAIALAALRAIDGRFFHIGPLDAAWLAEIRGHLATHGVDGARFVSLGLVPSVWGTLRELDDAALYIGSAPVSGGRAGVEAQGCGYPVLYFKGFEAGSLLADFSSYGLQELGWAGVDELGPLLAQAAARHAELSAAARRFYEHGFSREHYREALRRALG